MEILTESDLLTHLDEQLSLLEASCKSFDQGLDAQAKSMSTILRVLLYDKGSSKSLLGQLGLKDIYFLSTSKIYDSGYIGCFSGLTSIKMTLGEKGKVEHSPYLQFFHGVRRLTFDEWWNEFIFYINAQEALTRGSLIKEMADTDGGAHIDEKLKGAYGNLVKNNSIGIVGINNSGEFQLNSVERASMRQIAFEILLLLRKNGKTDFSTIIKTSGADKKIGRNEDCPCRSGKKYKQCHGK